jgi:agmatine deiminase
MATAHAAGLAMPAEWAPHERTLMAWPARVDAWRGTGIDSARRDYAEIARAIARFEPVLMIADPDDAAGARDLCGSDIEVVELPIDDSWIRDTGPVFVTGEGGRRAAVDFAFNSWGEKFLPYDRDADIARRVLEHLGVERRAAPMVLEGGSIAVDGEGTLVTTEQCLLNPNRNPSMSRDQIEAALREHLGVERIVWLEHGLVEDDDTDGHVDNVCAFVGPGAAVAQTVADPANSNHARLAANVERLRAAGIEVTELDVLPYAPGADRSVAIPYVNFYLVNGAVIVPVAGQDTDAAALELIGGACPGREVVGVPAVNLALGGGGVHCITQQVPAI